MNKCLTRRREKWSCLKVLLLISFLFCMLPNHALAQDTKAKFDFVCKNEPMPSVLKKVEQVSKFKVLFTYNEVQNLNVTVNLKSKTIDEVMQAILASHPLSYTIKGKYITVTYNGKLNKKMIFGIVIDNAGLPLPGVTVVSNDITVAGATNVDGEFSISIPEGKTITEVTFSYIGMQAETLPFTGEPLTVIMDEDSQQLGEVVVTGIFQKAKESYTGSVSKVSSEQLKMFRGQNLVQTLRNIDASVNIPLNNMLGSDPNNLPQINIRGTSSLPMSVDELNQNTQQSVNMPLVIMDGFEISLTKLMDYNDEEIESITILKDASATAIYGSRGANGVIVVETKRPAPGKLKVTAQVGMTFEVPDLNSYKLLNAADKLELERSIGLYNDNDNHNANAARQKQYNKRLMQILEGAETDWMSLPLRTGVGQRYNIRLEGGSEEFRWGASAGYRDVAGAMKGSSRKVFTGDITLMYSVKNLIFRNNTSISNTNSHNSKYGSFDTYVSQQPYNRPYDAEGNLIRYFDGFYSTSTRLQNPLYDVELNTFDQSEVLTLANNFAVDWRILPELTLRGQLGVSTSRNSSDLFYPAEHSLFSDTQKYPIGSLRRGSYTYGTGDDFSFDGHVTVSYSKIFKDVHQLYGGLDFSFSETKFKNYTFNAEGFSNEDLSFISNALQYPEGERPIGMRETSRRLGFTGNVNYTYDRRYFLDLSYRVDGSSQFGANKRYAPFWSAGLGWNLHHEKFMETIKLFNEFRLRASIGQTGAMDFAKSDVLTMYRYASGDQYAIWSAAHLQGLGNENLTWQKTDEKNLGLDFQLLDSRVFGSFNLYSKVTKGLVSYMNMPLSMGFPSYSDNVGEVKNSGFEVSLGAYLIRDVKREFTWSVNAQLVYNKNRIEKLSEAIAKQNEDFLEAGEVKNDMLPATLLYEGRPQYGLYVVRSLGIDPATGAEMFLDQNDNVTTTWNTKDRVYCGESQAPYRGNASTMIRWKDLSLNVSFGYQWGGQMYNSTLANRVEVTTGNIMNRNADERVFTERWQKPGDATFFKKIDSYSTKATSRFVMDDKWFEIQSISLEYRWNTDWLKRTTQLQSVLFGLNINNLAHFSSVRYERGTSYPFARNIQGTITIIF